MKMFSSIFYQQIPCSLSKRLLTPQMSLGSLMSWIEKHNKVSFDKTNLEMIATPPYIQKSFLFQKKKRKATQDLVTSLIYLIMEHYSIRNFQPRPRFCNNIYSPLQNHNIGKKLETLIWKKKNQ